MRKKILYVIGFLLLPFVIAGGALGLALAWVHLPWLFQPEFVGLLLPLCMLIFIVYRSRQADPIVRRAVALILLPILIGWCLFIVFGNRFFFLAGIAGTLFAVAWLNYLRFPPRLWRILRLGRQKKFPEALQGLNRWVSAHPQDWKALALRSDLHLARLQYAEAEQDARSLMRLKPDLHETHNQLGRILTAQARYEEAKAAFERAYGLKPYPNYLYNVAYMDYRLGNFGAAAEALSKVTERTLDLLAANLFACYYLGRSLEALGQQDRAEPAFQKMRRYARGLKDIVKQADDLPDYAEAKALRADLADIEQRLAA